MKKSVFSFLLLIFAFQLVSAQKGDLVVKNGDKGLYLEHKVAPKESFYAIGRTYNVSPKYLASYNKLEITKGLQIDQKLRIPLTDTNFVQQGKTGTPVYYKVGDKEGLMTVSNKNNKVLLANLRSWNKLSNDNLNPGAKLIVGFLITEGNALAINSNKPQPEVEKVEEKPVVTPPTVPVVTEEKPSKDEKKEEKKEAKAEEKAEKKEEKKDPEPVVAKESKPAAAGQGYFKTHFEQQIRNAPITKDETVTSGIFKTTSGWQDAKYYLLVDKVPAGTIVKVINPTNNKIVYAKVLGEMSGIRQNEGLNIRISNAAAAALEVKEDDKFVVKINY